ncbi:MAG: hypothetical protein ACYCYM_00830 [Saccharofermentanales bacterium]
MKDRLSQGKYTILHTKRGAVGLALIASFASLMILVPCLVFLLRVYFSKLAGDSAREILQIASINACQGIDSAQLGTGILVMDKDRAAQYFDESVNIQLSDKPYLQTIGDPDAAFTITGNIIIVESSIRILTAFGEEKIINNIAEFITETLPEG